MIVYSPRKKLLFAPGFFSPGLAFPAFEITLSKSLFGPFPKKGHVAKTRGGLDFFSPFAMVDRRFA